MKQDSGIIPLEYRRRVIAGLSLVVLFLGLLSAAADALLNHSASHFISCNHPGCDSRLVFPHLDRDEAKQKLPPCNACFFHKLVGSGLFPQENQIVAVASPPAHFFQISHTDYAQCFFPHEDNRGPPSIDSSTT